ncbi:MAG: amidohydrolase family protein [Candidatus Acidiferrales bacterium]
MKTPHRDLRLVFQIILALLFMAVPGKVGAQSSQEKGGTQLAKQDGLSLRATRKIEFSTDEGTWLSLDLSPDGKTIVFDLVGHLYELPDTGGEAKAITSGLSFDSQPRFSPDGKKIVYVSDQSGADNVWIANADGSDPRVLTSEDNTTFTSPAWTSDGEYILISQKKPSGYDAAFEIWMYDIKGGTGVRVTKSKPSEDAPSDTWHNAVGAVASPDGRYVYYSRKFGYFSDDVKFPLWQIARRDLHTGEEDVITDDQGSAVRPALSPDGTKLTYATRYDNGTALRIRDLVTGEDRWLKYPVQRDDQESYFPNRDLLPGYAFTPDGKDLLISIGGKIHRLSVETRQDTILPFRATVSRELGPKLDFPTRVQEGPVRARIIQGATEAADGRQIAFSALTHLYTQSLPAGEPQRINKGNAREYQPAWSPDGKWLAYVTWDDERGYLWKVSADGKEPPVQLTSIAAYYCEPVWSPDGLRVVVLRAPLEMAVEQMDQWGKPIEGLELASIPANGGPAVNIAFAGHYSYPHFAADNNRVYVTESHKTSMLQEAYSLVSMRLDGTDRRTLLVLKGKDIWGADFSPSVQIQLSPDGRKALAVYRSQLYLFDVPRTGGDPPSIDLSAPSVAVRRLTNLGADFASWARDGKTITWSLGSSYFRLPFADANAGVAELPPNDLPGAKASAASGGNMPGAARHFHPQEIHVAVQVARYTPTGTVLLKGAKLITMRGDEIIPAGDILIRDNRIMAVGTSGSISVPTSAKVIDVSGKTIVPGFIDIHAHWFNIRRGVLDLQNWDFLASLAFGITAGRDPQTFTNDIFAYQDLADAGEIIGPRAYSTGPGIFWVNDFHSEEEAEEVIRRYKEYYRTNTVKSYMVGNRRQREFVVEASNKLQMMPTTEGAADLALDMTHVIDGFSGAEHQFPMVLHHDLIDLVAQSGIFYDPTFIIGYGGPGSENYYFETTDVYDNSKVRRFIPHDVINSKTTRLTWYRKDEYAYPTFAESASEIMKAGGKVCVGGHGEFQGLSFHWELWSLQSGGMSNLDALRAATLNGAEAIGRSQDLGSIAAGKLADLVVLDKDPLQDIQNTTSIRFVMKNGELFDGETLNEVWPTEKTAGPFWWWSDHP